MLKWDTQSIMEGNGVHPLLRECTSTHVLNANGLSLCSPCSLQMADCGGMPQVDQVCMSVFV